MEPSEAMRADLIERLRDSRITGAWYLRQEAADELTALRERVAELEGALERIVSAPMIDHRNPENSAQNIARAALSAAIGEDIGGGRG